MITLSKEPSYYLVNPREILQKNLENQLLQSDLDALLEIIKWAHNFLCKPNAQLGRDGAVCPYTKPSMHKNLFWLTVYRDQEITLDKAIDAVMTYKDWFLELEPKEGNDAQYKTILILFPDVAKEEAPKIIDNLQQMLKPNFVKDGLMIGQFHELCEEAGLWNPDFRPLRSPVPMLAIRHIIPSDFPFLKSNPEFVLSYLTRFAVNIPPQTREYIAKAVCNL